MGAMKTTPGLYDEDLVKLDKTVRRLNRTEYKFAESLIDLVGAKPDKSERVKKVRRMYLRHLDRLRAVFNARMRRLQDDRINTRRKRKAA